jgi:hypothetical protein
MKYTIQKLDGRFSYNQEFKYYVGFSNRMSNNLGPQQFTQAQKWFVDTYGWSAEIRHWNDIRNWYVISVPIMATKGSRIYPTNDNVPIECNPHWSWSNSYEDLRIYIASDKELAFFQLVNPMSNSV